MKTFKLNSFSVLLNEQEQKKKYPIDLIDGLIINREDEEGQWLTEAYIDKKYNNLFQRLKSNTESLMIEVKITKESNTPVTFNTRILEINEISDSINVLLIGKMIDKRKSIVEELLSKLISEGHQGQELLERFKEQV